VKTLLEINQEHETSRCAVGIYMKERCLLPQIRASTHLSMDFVENNLENILDSEILVIEGYFIIEKFNIVQYLVKHFKESNKKIIFTLSATFIVDNFYDKVLEICNEADVIVCNNEEASAFSKSSNSDMEQIALAIHKLLKQKERLLMITCGKQPAILSRYNYEKNCFDYILRSYVYLIPEEEIVDTDSAGDCKC
jgi:adenosine kinase